MLPGILPSLQSAFALTFVEILTVSRVDFFDVLEDFENEKAIVRKAGVRMVMKRGILHCAKAIMERTLKEGGFGWGEV